MNAISRWFGTDKRLLELTALAVMWTSLAMLGVGILEIVQYVYTGWAFKFYASIITAGLAFFVLMVAMVVERESRNL